MKLSMRYLIPALALCLLLPGTCLASTATRSTFGSMPDGRKVEAVKLDNSHGVAVTVITYSKGYYRMTDMLVPGAIISVVWVIVMTALMVRVAPLLGLL